MKGTISAIALGIFVSYIVSGCSNDDTTKTGTKKSPKEEFAETCYFITEKIAPLYGKKYAIDAIYDNTCKTTANMPGYVEDMQKCAVAGSLWYSYSKNMSYDSARASAVKECIGLLK